MNRGDLAGSGLTLQVCNLPSGGGVGLSHGCCVCVEC